MERVSLRRLVILLESPRVPLGLCMLVALAFKTCPADCQSEVKFNFNLDCVKLQLGKAHAPLCGLLEPETDRPEPGCSRLGPVPVGER